jgi:hypothetical protein
MVDGVSEMGERSETREARATTPRAEIWKNIEAQYCGGKGGVVAVFKWVHRGGPYVAQLLLNVWWSLRAPALAKLGRS